VSGARVVCDGLPAGWLNGWMAAVGATVLDEGVRLHWDPESHRAVLSAARGDPVARLVAAWPSGDLLADLPIAEHWRGAGTLKRKVDLEAFAARACAARNHPLSWTLSSTLTDLAVDAAGEVAHARFDPPGPGPIKWLHHRLLKAWRHVSAPSAERLRASLLGEAERVQDNGLGFDHSRLASSADDGGRWTDPAVEVLAFFALALLPMRGRGTDRRVDPFAFVDQRQRGWRRTPGLRDARRFHWPAWRQPPGADGIDALLDIWQPEPRERWPLVGVHAAWRTVAFQPHGVDKTRAFGSERLLDATLRA